MRAFPFLLRRLKELRLIDEAEQAALARDGILTLADLELAIAENKPLATPGLRHAAAKVAQELRPFSLGRAWDVLDPLLAALGACPDVQSVEPSGAVGRAEPLVDLLIIVGRAGSPQRATEAAASLAVVGHVVFQTSRRLVALVEGHAAEVRPSPSRDS